MTSTIVTQKNIGALGRSSACLPRLRNRRRHR